MKTIPMYVYLVYSTYDYNGKNMFWNNSLHTWPENKFANIHYQYNYFTKKKAIKQLWISSNLDSS